MENLGRRQWVAGQQFVEAGPRDHALTITAETTTCAKRAPPGWRTNAGADHVATNAVVGEGGPAS